MGELGKYRRCDICCEWHWTGNKCPPAYEVFHEEYLGDEPHTFRAHSFEGAAEKYAKNYNEGNGDYCMMDGEEITIRVVKDGKESRFAITAEPSVDYHIYEEKE